MVSQFFKFHHFYHAALYSESAASYTDEGLIRKGVIGDLSPAQKCD